MLQFKGAPTEVTEALSSPLWARWMQVRTCAGVRKLEELINYVDLRFQCENWWWWCNEEDVEVPVQQQDRQQQLHSPGASDDGDDADNWELPASEGKHCVLWLFKTD